MRGISPVVATLLLIAIVVALAILLYMLSTSFFQEDATRDINRRVISFSIDSFYKEGITSKYDFEAAWKFYKIINEPKTFEEASRYCISLGMTLATSLSVDSYYISAATGRMVSQGIVKAWVGIREEEENVWKNFVGESLELSNVYVWAAGQPDNNNGVEHVAALRSDGTLEDLNALERLPFICERYIYVFTIRNLSEEKIHIDDVVVSVFLDHVSGRKYYYIREKPLTWMHTVRIREPSGTKDIYQPFFKCYGTEVLPGRSVTCYVIMQESSFPTVDQRYMKLCVTIGASTQCKDLER